MPDKTERPLRDALRLVSPGPVALVSTMYRDQPNLMTASWIQPISLDPVRLAIAVNPSRLTHKFLTKTEQFVLNIPHFDLLTAVHHCGLQSGRDIDKFAAVGLTPAESVEIEAPRVAECVAHVECTVYDRITLGDHDLFIADVLQVSVVDEAFDTIWKLGNDAARLIHHLGGDQYAGLARSYGAASDLEEDKDRRSRGE